MSAEDDLGWEYFGPDPMNSPRMQEHMAWHDDPANKFHTGNYGERFLEFHRQFVEKFNQFRLTKGLIRVSGWDPATPIPAYLSHDHVLTAARNTDNPFSVDPHCATPTWATVQGGTTPDPVYGYTSLLHFRSADELGKAIDSGWHGLVHNTIGGDMSQFHSPIDPVFWRWHTWIDNVRATWEAVHIQRVHLQAAWAVRVLTGVINDAPGWVIGPDGKPVPVPGGPGPIDRPAAEHAHLAVGMAIERLVQLVRDPRDRAQLSKLGAGVVSKETKLLAERMAGAGGG